MGHQLLHGAAATALLLLAATAWEAAASPELVGSSASVVEVLMSKMKSPLSKSEASTYAELYKRTGSLENLCQAGHFYCDAQAYDAYYEKVLQPEENVEEKDIAVYFRESELVVGHQVTIADPRLQSAAIERNRQIISKAAKGLYINFAKLPERAFLPVELARILPFNSGSTAQIFGLDDSSTLAKESRKTVELCNEAMQRDGTTAIKGEAVACAKSKEELQSLLQSAKFLGSREASNVEALTSESRVQGSITGQVMEVRLKASEKSRHAVCHNLMYPSAIYFCHYLANTRVYSVTLMQEQDIKQPLRWVAICHLDTSGWNHAHLAFQNLRTLPGHSEACHWVLQGSVTFVPAA